MIGKTYQGPKQTTLATTLALAVSVALSSAATADSLRIAVPADPGYLDPAYWGSSSEQLLIDNIYPRLGTYATGDAWQIELDAAKSVDLSDPQNIVFELKPGIMWSGGYGELTAQDVEYSFERHNNPDLESGVAAEFSLMTDVEVTGKYTGIIHLSAPSPSFWTATLTYTSGAIISKAAAEASDGYLRQHLSRRQGHIGSNLMSPGRRLFSKKIQTGSAMPPHLTRSSSLRLLMTMPRRWRLTPER